MGTNKVLNDKEVATIKRLHRKGKRVDELSAEFGCSVGTISSVINNVRSSAYYNPDEELLLSYASLQYLNATNRGNLDIDTLNKMMEVIRANISGEQNLKTKS